MVIPLFLADISPLPFVIAGGGILIAICGFILSLFVFVTGIMKRHRNHNKSKPN